MKKMALLSLVILLFATSVRSQNTIEECVQALNKILQEANGQLKIFTDSRFIVDESSAKWVNNMLEISMRSDNELFVNRFDPAYVKSITINPQKNNSPVGTIRLELINFLSAASKYNKKSLAWERIDDEVYLNYLQVDEKAGKKIESLIEKIKSLQKSRQLSDPLVDLADEKMAMKNVWLSDNQSAYTFDFQFAAAAGCELWIKSDYKRVSKSGDESGTRIIVIPLEEIDRVVLERKVTKPASYLIELDKKKIKWYKYDSDKKLYVSTYGYLDRIPLFIPVDFVDKDATMITDLLTRARKACGEGKVKFKEIN